MKKICLILITILCLTGCSSVVNIDIGNDKVSEEVVLTAGSDNEYYKIKNANVFPLTLYYDQELKNPFNANEEESGVRYYNVTSDIDSKKVTVTGNFDYDSHVRSSVVRNCFKLYNILKENNEVIFSTSEGIICSYNKFTLNVTTPYVVTSSNASKIDRSTNTYTWNFNKQNARNAYVNLKIDLSKKANAYNGNFNDEEISSKSNNNVLFITILMIVFMIVISVIYVYKKKKSSSDV